MSVRRLKKSGNRRKWAVNEWEWLGVYESEWERVGVGVNTI